jgi:SAM-dependent methyltransferase
MRKIKHLNKPTTLVLLILMFLLSTYYFKSQQINDYFSSMYFSYVKKKQIKNWFNRKALVEHDSENLHYGSAWGYLTTEQFKEIILDGMSKMSPQINNGDKIFELGVGVGAALKVIENAVGTDQLELWGSDIAENAIHQAKKNFPKQSDHFFVSDMTQRHNNILDNYYDHVLSFGALGMYLTKNDMKKAIKEAVRITKPGGSLLFTAFVEPDGKTIRSIVSPIEQSFFEEHAKEWGIENIKIYEMKHQGDRYQVTFNKSRE